ncbi:MAG: hypothetical protein ACTSP5_05385 [Candidatus Heimdallarchaeota archaeon]
MGKEIDKVRIHALFSFDFDQYIASFTQSDFFIKLLLNFFEGYPENPKPDLGKLMLQAQKIEWIKIEGMKGLTRKEFDQYESGEAYAYAKAKDFKEIAKYPKYLQALGDLYYQAKTAPEEIHGIKNPVNYLDFIWHINSRDIVFKHCYFEAFLAKTIDAICEAKPEIMYDYLVSKRTTREFLEKLSKNELIERVHSRIGTSIDRRLTFLQEHCLIETLMESDRKAYILFLEQVRNIVVHNNGIISNLFEKKIKKAGLTMDFLKQEVGERIRLRTVYAEIQRAIYHYFISDLFREVCQKYLGIK